MLPIQSNIMGQRQARAGFRASHRAQQLEKIIREEMKCES